MAKTVVDIYGRSQDCEYAIIGEYAFLSFKKSGITEDQLFDCNLMFVSGYTDDEIYLMINDEGVEDFSGEFKKKYADEIELYQEALAVPSGIKQFYVLHDEGFKGTNYQIEISEKFNIEKLEIRFERVEINGEAHEILYKLRYDGKDLELIDGGDSKCNDVSLFDKDDKQTYIDFHWSGDDEDDEEMEEDD
jgi:hypothetical protein